MWTFVAPETIKNIVFSIENHSFAFDIDRQKLTKNRINLHLPLKIEDKNYENTQKLTIFQISPKTPPPRIDFEKNTFSFF